MISEKAVIGTLLKEPYLIKETDLSPIHLEQQTNKKLLEIIRHLDNSNKSIDLVNIISAAEPNQFGGVSNLQHLQTLSNAEKFDEYVDNVMDKWREREKLSILHLAQQDSWSIDKIKTELDRLTNDKTTDYKPINELLMDIYEAPYIKQEQQKGVPTGLPQVDRVTGGWQNSDLIILAARPSMGKTDVMLHFAKQAGWHGYLPIVFSLEMAGERLRDRMIASTGGYNRGKFKNLERFLTDDEKKRWTTTIGKVDETNVQIFDRAGQTLSEMRVKIRKALSEHPDKKPMIFVDYLTLIKPSEDMGGNMHLQVSGISKGLKAIAKEFDCPVMSLAQLSRGVEQRQDKRPLLSDLRESGSIEEDADVVLYLYRDAYYTKNRDDRSLELIFAKHRNGETGMVDAEYENETGAIREPVIY